MARNRGVFKGGGGGAKGASLQILVGKIFWRPTLNLISEYALVWKVVKKCSYA